MNNYDTYVETIINSLYELRDNEFRVNSYVPPVSKNKQATKTFTRRDKQDIAFTRRNIIQSKSKKHLKNTIRNNNKDISKDRGEELKDQLEEDTDILTYKNIFNVIQNEDYLVKWKDLEFEVKKKKINDYINKYHNDFPEKILNKIFTLIEKNKINFKKYICYNKLTKIVDDMPIINNSDGYSLNYSTVKKKKRKKITF